MKKNIIVSLILLITYTLVSAQFLKKDWSNDSIYVYSTAYTQPYLKEIPIDTVWQGLWGPDSVGSFYDIEILESNGLRHMIKYTPSPNAERYANCDNTDSVFKEKTGWVDKKNVVVFLWPETIENNSYTDFKYYSILNLYNTPTDSIPFKKISMNYAFDDANVGFEFHQPGPFTITMPIIEISSLTNDRGQKWIKVLFISDEGPIEGWTLDYCPYIGGCYGW